MIAKKQERLILEALESEDGAERLGLAIARSIREELERKAEFRNRPLYKAHENNPLFRQEFVESLKRKHRERWGDPDPDHA